MEARREQLAIDPLKCTGCQECLIACSMKHQGVINLKLAMLKIIRLETQELEVPVICMACDNAPCIKVCPMNARIRQENGTVATNTDVCIGCRACVYICPAGSPAVNPYTGQTMTCDMCGGDEAGPWCVVACREGALRITQDDMLTRGAVRERAARSRAIFPN
ncbi:MAG: 4Fe-4S dicluster domain-containing protein [Syntrophales bacterium]